MTPILLLPLLEACGRSPESPTAADTDPRAFTLAYQGNVAAELEPCG